MRRRSRGWRLGAGWCRCGRCWGLCGGDVGWAGRWWPFCPIWGGNWLEVKVRIGEGEIYFSSDTLVPTWQPHLLDPGGAEISNRNIFCVHFRRQLASSGAIPTIGSNGNGRRYCRNPRTHSYIRISTSRDPISCSLLAEAYRLSRSTNVTNPPGYLCNSCCFHLAFCTSET